jgi:Fuc2NAc and GlcNAc transferase
MQLAPGFLLFLAGAFFASTLGTVLYLRFARARGIVAVPNKRSLHIQETALGGGIVIASVFLFGLAILYARGLVAPNAFMALAAGGSIMTLIGFADDAFEISARLRFAVHIGLSLFSLYCFGGFPPLPIGIGITDLGWVGNVLAALGLVWLINLYNFMDGIDGMAASGTVFFALAAAALLLAFTDAQGQAAVCAILGAAASGFLVFNWPPARVFMGDAGSTFLGYVFGALILMTASTGTMSVWTWAILMGCFVADTGTTLLLRVWKVPNWYRVAHRSHAYQNLARVWADHRKVTGGAVLINLFWLLPLAWLSMQYPHPAPLLALLALLPLVGVSLKYGPLYSSA